MDLPKLYLEYPWIIPKLPSIIHGLSLYNPLITPGLSLDFPWIFPRIIHELYLDHPWPIGDIPVYLCQGSKNERAN